MHDITWLFSCPLLRLDALASLVLSSRPRLTLPHPYPFPPLPLLLASTSCLIPFCHRQVTAWARARLSRLPPSARVSRTISYAAATTLPTRIHARPQQPVSASTRRARARQVVSRARLYLRPFLSLQRAHVPEVRQRTALRSLVRLQSKLRMSHRPVLQLDYMRWHWLLHDDSCRGNRLCGWSATCPCAHVVLN